MMSSSGESGGLSSHEELICYRILCRIIEDLSDDVPREEGSVPGGETGQGSTQRSEREERVEVQEYELVEVGKSWASELDIGDCSAGVQMGSAVSPRMGGASPVERAISELRRNQSDGCSSEGLVGSRIRSRSTGAENRVRVRERRVTRRTTRRLRIRIVGRDRRFIDDSLVVTVNNE